MVDLRTALAATNGELVTSERWRRLLTAVEDAGGTVSRDEWRTMGITCGYDARGLGGFYRGRNASMRVNSDGTRSLTAAGKAYLDEHGRVR